MDQKTTQTLQWLFFNLKPTTLAAIVADLDEGNTSGTYMELVRQLAQQAGESNVGDNDFSLMVEQAYEYVG